MVRIGPTKLVLGKAFCMALEKKKKSRKLSEKLEGKGVYELRRKGNFNSNPKGSVCGGHISKGGIEKEEAQLKHSQREEKEHFLLIVSVL